MSRYADHKRRMFPQFVKQRAAMLKLGDPPEPIVRGFVSDLANCFGRDAMQTMLKAAMAGPWPSDRERQTEDVLAIHDTLTALGDPKPTAELKRLYGDPGKEDALERRLRRARERRKT